MRITEAKDLAQYRVFLRFDNEASGIIDLSYLAGRGVFRAWEQAGSFEQLSISPEGALQWPGGLDLCPDALQQRMIKGYADEPPVTEAQIAEIDRRMEAYQRDPSQVTTWEALKARLTAGNAI